MALLLICLKKLPNTPVIIVTGLGNEEIAVRAMKLALTII
jgi:FixJ family two-component response regulator